jgi:iron-sulfur cluster repair protein YtfE (RIC family)
MGSIDRADPVILGHILALHRDLHVHVQAARAAFGDSGPPDADRVEGLRATLGLLREHLREHFEQEERGGFLEESVTRMPRLSQAMSQVIAEHPALLAELDGLIGTLEGVDISGPSAAGAWAAAERDFDRFARNLISHERNENAVVQEGYNEDLGLVD